VDYDFLMDKLLGAWLCFLASGCAVATQITPTARSSIEQKLLVQALERAFDGLDSQLVKGKTIAVEFYGLTPDKDFARELFIAHLQSEGAIIPPIPSAGPIPPQSFRSRSRGGSRSVIHRRAIVHGTARRLRSPRDSSVS
jgi:hypothetical protein